MRSISGFTSIYCKSYAGLIFLHKEAYRGQYAPHLESRGMDLSNEEGSPDSIVIFNLQLLSRHSDFSVASFLSHMDLAKDPLSSQNQIFGHLKYIIGKKS